MTKGFAKDFLRYIPSKAIPFIMAFAFVPILTRLISPEEYGIFTLILTFNIMMMTLVTGWLYPSTIRFYPDYNITQKQDVYLSSFFFCLFASSRNQRGKKSKTVESGNIRNFVTSSCNVATSRAAVSPRFLNSESPLASLILVSLRPWSLGVLSIEVAGIGVIKVTCFLDHMSIKTKLKLHI